MDLKGAPYAYTPFCDNNKDMEGFRFWKQGFWRDHLQGKPYHISALYGREPPSFRYQVADYPESPFLLVGGHFLKWFPDQMLRYEPVCNLRKSWGGSLQTVVDLARFRQMAAGKANEASE